MNLAKIAGRKILLSSPVKRLVISIAKRIQLRTYLNSGLNSSPEVVKRVFHDYFHDLFRDVDCGTIQSSTWKVFFAGKTIELPLRTSHFTTDWNLALSAMGRERNLVKTLEKLININGSASPAISMFLDIGANYGVYSLFFLVHGIDTLSFEPNTSCGEYLNFASQLNHVIPHLENVALSNETGTVELRYPKSDTWIGSIETDVHRRMEEAGYKLLSVGVPKRKLDGYIGQLTNRNILIKIDTEGHELSVLQRGRDVLIQLRPIIIFEYLIEDRERNKEIFDFLLSMDYVVLKLPYTPNHLTEALQKEALLVSPDADYIAVPKELRS